MKVKTLVQLRGGAEVCLEDLVDSATADRNEGVCARCGEWQGGCEPDARKYKCEACGSLSVYGCEELALRLA